jgi:hypothetical protein
MAATKGYGQIYEKGETMARIIKTVCISVDSIRGYSRKAWRVVRCLPEQRGYRSERGVEVLWESEPLYRPYTKRGQGAVARQYAEQVARNYTTVTT